MVIKINTFYILRAEVQMYADVCAEVLSLIEKHLKEFEEMQNQIEEIREKLYKIKTISNSEFGQGQGGIRVEVDSKYLSLIDKQVKLEKFAYQKFICGPDIINEYNSQYLDELNYWCNRIETVEYYLNQLDPADREFICDLYIDKSFEKNNDKVRFLQEKYVIGYAGDLYRKGKKILKKVVEIS